MYGMLCYSHTTVMLTLCLPSSMRMEFFLFFSNKSNVYGSLDEHRGIVCSQNIFAEYRFLQTRKIFSSSPQFIFLIEYIQNAYSIYHFKPEDDLQTNFSKYDMFLFHRHFSNKRQYWYRFRVIGVGTRLDCFWMMWYVRECTVER